MHLKLKSKKKKKSCEVTVRVEVTSGSKRSNQVSLVNPTRFHQCEQQTLLKDQTDVNQRTELL